MRPMVKLVANMHGNEPVGRELIVHLAKYLLKFSRAGDDRVAIQQDFLARSAPKSALDAI